MIYNGHITFQVDSKFPRKRFAFSAREREVQISTPYRDVTMPPHLAFGRAVPGHSFLGLQAAPRSRPQSASLCPRKGEWSVTAACYFPFQGGSKTPLSVLCTGRKSIPSQGIELPTSRLGGRTPNHCTMLGSKKKKAHLRISSTTTCETRDKREREREDFEEPNGVHTVGTRPRLL